MASEASPLLGDEETGDGAKKNWDKLRTEVFKGVFRRSSVARLRSIKMKQSPRGSIRGTEAFEEGGGLLKDSGNGHLAPIEALSPLVAGGIVGIGGQIAKARPASSVKSLPAFAPYRRKARHRSFYLWWLNEFRHWWKSSRLLVRLSGLGTYARDPINWYKMTHIAPYKNKESAIAKNSHRALKLMKQLGRGGVMRFFLKRVKPFTRTMRIVVGSWRWIEAAQCRRLEVGVEEFMAFLGNRVSRMLARTIVDTLFQYVIMTASGFIFKNGILPEEAWHPAILLVIVGVIRACSPYAASFQGSRAGRVLTRQFFISARHRWQPIQRVEHLNLTSDDCCEQDEVSENADLAKLAKVIAKALGKAQKIGVEGMEGQTQALEAEGFFQVGAGSGGYAVYECHRRVWKDGAEATMSLLLHVTPYGPSILDVMPRYVVLEREESVDRRTQWSEFMSKQVWEGPPILEGYCYQGAFFSPHHFAELKERYDGELLTYDNACKALCKPSSGRNPNPPTDLSSLKAFLANGKKGRKQKKNDREGRELQSKVKDLAEEMKSMMSQKKQAKLGGDVCCAPRGVILYFEGLDCSGKSSTGGLVQSALDQAGFDVQMCQYNRPPTPEQKLRPWMDRFEVPGTAMAVSLKDEDGEKTKDIMEKCIGHEHNAVVWDRGPAGDFVYGALSKADDDEKKARFNEFMEFDKKCFENNILFCKLLFVTNRDSIAKTLGKRLAQKKMAQDLRTWLKASRGDESDFGEIGFEGLDEIDLHIDPTDFIAFNSYLKNLRIFTNFALNTDSKDNPWIVVNTGNRYAARKQLLKAFKLQLERFKTKNTCCRPSTASSPQTIESTQNISLADMIDRGFKKRLSMRSVLLLMGLLIIVYYYCINTKFDTFVWRKGEGLDEDTDIKDLVRNGTRALKDLVLDHGERFLLGDW